MISNERTPSMNTATHDTPQPALWARVVFVTLITIVGSFIYAVGINLFYEPEQFLSGGLVGIAMVLHYTSDVPIGVTNFLLNIPILLLSLKFMGKAYTLVTILGTALCSFFIDLTSWLSVYNTIHDPLVSAVAGGVVLGVGNGILYRYNSNTGGLDVIGAIMKKYFGMDISYVVFGLNFLIVISSAWIFAMELAICTLIAMYISASVSSRLVVGFAQRKAAFIVSDKPLEIADAILRNIHHGATLLYGQGAFSGMDKRIVFAIVDLTQVTRLRRYVAEVDPHAFLFIMNTTDVVGRGFTRPLSTTKTMPHSFRYTSNAEGELVPTRMWQYEMDEEANPGASEAARTEEKMARERMSYRK